MEPPSPTTRDRFWGIVFMVALAALVLSALFGGVSLIFWLVGWFRTELVIAGIAEMLLSLDFLIVVRRCSPRAVRLCSPRTVRRCSLRTVRLCSLRTHGASDLV